MRFRTILADPPWNFENWNTDYDGRSARQHYSTMTIEDIKRMPVAAIADRDAVLMLWTCWPHLEQAQEVIRAWGFTFKTGFPWVKMVQAGVPRRGLGFHVMACSEPLLIATRGKGACPPAGSREIGIMFNPPSRHSAKPEQQYQFAERYPGPYIELFARPQGGLMPLRSGWTQIGNEITGRDIREDICLLAAMDAPAQGVRFMERARTFNFARTLRTP